MCPCPLLDYRRLALSLRLLVVWFRINPIPLALFQNPIMLLLQFSFVNYCLSVKVNDKSSQGSSFSGFGASSFPGNFESKDFEIHDSSIGKMAPVYDKSFSQLLGGQTS